MATVGSRIGELVRALGITGLQFSKIVGISDKMLSLYMRDMRPATTRVISFICLAYPDVNRDWLEYGKGSMFKGGKTPSTIKVNPASTGRRIVCSALPPAEREEPQQPTELSNGDVIAPYYEVDFACGFPLFENDQTVNPDRFIVSPINRKDVTVWCNATGRSMEPTIMSGDAVALEKIEDITQIIYGEIYAIVTDSYRTIKRVCGGSSKEVWKLVSDNKESIYEAQEILIADVKQVYRVTGTMHRF